MALYCCCWWETAANMKQKAVRNRAANFYNWMGWTKSLFRYKSQRQWELKTAQKLLEESGTLLKGSWGVSSPAFLIQKSGRASVFSLLLKNSPTNCVQGKAGCFWDPQPSFTSTPISGKPELHLKLLSMVFNLWSSTNYNGSNHDPCRRIEEEDRAPFRLPLPQFSWNRAWVDKIFTRNKPWTNTASAVIHHWSDTTNRPKLL